MYYVENRHVLFVVYDGIKNSVFTSQVLTPLLSRLEKEQDLEITLLSFERSALDAEYLREKIPAHDRLHLALGKRWRYWGIGSLLFPTYQCFKLLHTIPCHEIVARGPLAGYIVSKAFAWLKRKYGKREQLACTTIRVQARGLCAAEYQYAYSKRKRKTLYSWMVMKLITRSLYKLEQIVFGKKNKQKGPEYYFVESVSPALSTYLRKEFNTYPQALTLAQADIPQVIDKMLVDKWRKRSRSVLNIPHDAIVYCYSGSFKPWQCAEETIVYFAEKAKKENKAFLLVLSQDKELFIKALHDYGVLASQYHVCSVSQDKLYEYLAAADFGILFRDWNIINWVARPTKVLEYEAVGLTILHNNTVAWLATESAKNRLDSL